MKIEVTREQRETPEHVSRWLLELGGTNPYGEPNFAIGWDADGRLPYWPPCWCLLQWISGEDFGETERYPRGKYEIIQPMPAVKGELSHKILAALVGIIRQHEHDSIGKRRELLSLRRKQEENALQNRIADQIHDALPEHFGPTSFARQQVTTNEIQRRMEQIERNGVFQRIPKGMRIHGLNP